MYYSGLPSQRLVYRPLTEDDIPVWAEFFTSPEATRFLPDFGYTLPIDRSRHMIEKQLERYNENRYGMHALIEKNTHHFIGLCGLLLQEPDGIQELEVGYHLLPKHWHKGYATEAAKNFRDFAFNNELRDSVVSMIHVDNFPSQNVALRNGMNQERITNSFFNIPHYIYRITKQEWEKNN
jgi:RimJ/RimL family protein N-acetyltransferase